MRLRVRHITAYTYGDTVPLCHNVVHLKPRDTARQTCLDYELIVEPEPSIVREGVDYFGNNVAYFSLQDPHRGLKVTAVSTVVMNKGDGPPKTSIPWEQAVIKSGEMGDSDARNFAFESPYIPTARELADYAIESFPAGRPLAEAAVDLMGRIFKDFKFVAGVTNVGTPVLDVLRDRRGVCQDFTHLMLGMFRSLGLPARYVSGYLLTAPPPGKPRLVGADASHAWVSVHVPGHGWLDLDPTNNVVPSDGHVTVGWARDYSDIGPVRGVVVGGRQHSLDVSVDVEPLAD